MQWSFVSKAAERSNSVKRETLPESSARRNVICYFERGTFSAMVKAVGGLRRTDETVFSEVGKQRLENNLLCDS